MNQLPQSIEQLDGLRKNGSGWVARCPVHEDNNPSLSITVTDDGTVLVHCHAGCDQADVARALDLHRQDGNATSEWTPRGDAVAVYRYVDEDGAHLFDVCRTADKQFPQRRPDPTAKSGWRWSLGDTRRVPYRLPEVRQAVAEGRSVCITEGEKDVEALRASGRVATCNPGGAGKWKPEYAAHFIDANVTIFADKDKPGQEHARQVAASLDGVAATVWIVEAADPHKDVAAHLAAGLSLNDVTVTRRPTEAAFPDLAPDIYDILEEDIPDYDWLVPNLLERGDRFMLTGGEGLGKSMYMRMLSVCFAAGIHPVTFQRHAPLRVLVVDCENSKRQTRRAFGPIVAEAAKLSAVPRGNLRLIRRPEGIDLGREEDSAWLLERVTAHSPDILVIGPLYRLFFGNPNDETVARNVVAAIDAARLRADCAVLIEAHSGHGEWGKSRSVRPLGSSLYLRWAEFGYGLRAIDEQINERRPNCVDVIPFRGDRDSRMWPTLLEHGTCQGNEWPWVPALPQRDVPSLPPAAGQVGAAPLHLVSNQEN